MVTLKQFSLSEWSTNYILAQITILYSSFTDCFLSIFFSFISITVCHCSPEASCLKQYSAARRWPGWATGLWCRPVSVRAEPRLFPRGGPCLAPCPPPPSHRQACGCHWHQSCGGGWRGGAKAPRSLPGSGQGNVPSSDGGKSHGGRFRGGSFVIPRCWHGSWSSSLSPCNDIACTGDDVWPHYQSLIGLLHSFTFSFSLASSNCFLSSSLFLSHPASDSSLKAFHTCFESKLIIFLSLVFFM